MNTHDIELPPLPYPYNTPAYRTVGMVIQEYATEAIEADRKKHQEALNSAYTQRNALAVAFANASIAAGWIAGRGFDNDASKAWSNDWRHVVYVDLPDGRQVSWHMSPNCVPLLDGLPEYKGTWDGTYVARDAEWCQFKADRKRRGEPVAFFYELATSFDTYQMYSNWSPKLSFSMPNVPDGSIRNLKWLYAAPQPAEPVELDRYDAGLLGGQDGMPAYVWHDIIRAELDRAYDFYMDQLDRVTPQPAETSQEPSDDDLLAFGSDEQFFLFCDEEEFLYIARTLLARYGATPKFGEE